MINVAVVGSGYWGKNLVRNFYELNALHTICDNNPETLGCFQEKYPDKYFQTSFGAVLLNPEIDAAVIATPAETHFNMAKKALLAGKHVFVEKPLALIVSEAEELQQLAFIGAGAVVTKDVPDYALVVGNPGRIVGWMCECGHQLTFNEDAATCSACEKPYCKVKEDIRPVSEEGKMVRLKAVG